MVGRRAVAGRIFSSAVNSCPAPIDRSSPDRLVSFGKRTRGYGCFHRIGAHQRGTYYTDTERDALLLSPPPPLHDPEWAALVTPSVFPTFDIDLVVSPAQKVRRAGAGPADLMVQCARGGGTGQLGLGMHVTRSCRSIQDPNLGRSKAPLADRIRQIGMVLIRLRSASTKCSSVISNSVRTYAASSSQVMLMHAG